MDKQYVIFDMDGTLVDSMGYWMELPREYLNKQGVFDISDELLEQVAVMTVTDAAVLLAEVFHLGKSPQTMAAEMDAMMEEHYRRDVPLKPGVKERLRELRERGVRMCVASATSAPLVEACLTRVGVREEFRFLLSCEDLGVGKDRPDIYLEAARRFGTSPGEIAVYEDALYAAKTVKQAGFYLVGVYDDSAADDWEQLKALSDEQI